MSSLIKQIPLTSGYNFLNGGFEEGTKNYRTYKDAVQASPVDGVDGTTLYTTLSSSSVNPLLGLNSGIISKSNSNAQGEGVSTDFTIDTGVLSNNAVISFLFETSANYIAGDISLYLYDITNSVVYTPSISSLPKSIGVNEFKTNCYFNITSTKYRLIFHIASASVLDYTVKLDNIEFNSTAEVIGSVIGEWTSYTPIFQGFGTPTNVSVQWRRVGSSVEIRGRLTTGTTTAVEARLGLPNSIISRSNVATLEHVGHVLRNVVLTGIYQFPVYIEPNVSYLTFGRITNTDNWVAKQNGNALFGGGENITIMASVPISTWTSNINLITDFTEYASNSSTTDATDTTSFVYGPSGSLIPNKTTTATNIMKNVRFLRDMQDTDTLVVEVNEVGTSGWIPIEQRLNSLIRHNVYSYGVRLAVIDSKTVSVVFHQGGYSPSSTTYDQPGILWSTLYSAGWKWRVRKISNGNTAESIPSGIYESNSNANGSYVKYIDGTMKQWGWGYVTCAGGSANYSSVKSLPVTFVGDYDIVASTIGYYSGASPTSRLDFSLQTGAFATAQPLSGGATFNALVKWTTTFGAANYQVGYSYVAEGRWNNALSVSTPGSLVGITIEESGSNSNGTYVKYSDGTLVCYGTTLCVSLGVNYTVTFPMAYISTPILITNHHGLNYATTIVGVANNTTSGQVVSSTASRLAAWVVYGKWK